jgi:hypothetical protein
MSHEPQLSSEIWRLWRTWPFKGATSLGLLFLIVFAATVCIRAWRRHESVFDVIEFDGWALWKRAPIVAFALIVALFLSFVVFNNLYRASDVLPEPRVAPPQDLPSQEATPAAKESSPTPTAIESSPVPRQVVCPWGEYLNAEQGRCVRIRN